MNTTPRKNKEDRPWKVLSSCPNNPGPGKLSLSGVPPAAQARENEKKPLDDLSNGFMVSLFDLRVWGHCIASLFVPKSGRAWRLRPFTGLIRFYVLAQRVYACQCTVSIGHFLRRRIDGGNKIKFYRSFTMGNSPSENRKRKVYTLTISPEIFERFRSACGLIPVSRQVEELMKKYLSPRQPIQHTHSERHYVPEVAGNLGIILSTGKSELRDDAPDIQIEGAREKEFFEKKKHIRKGRPKPRHE